MPEGSRFFALPPGAAFATEFARGFHDRHQDADPVTVAQTRILANSGRTQRLIEEALADTAPRPGPLPRIQAMSQLFADPGLAPDLPPAISQTRRQLRLTRLVEAYLRNRASSGESLAPLSAAADLAQSLTLLIDQMHDEGIGPDELETALSEGDLANGAAAHWQQNLVFIDIVRKNWPAILAEAEAGAIDPRARQRAVIDTLIADWRNAPPHSAIIAVGSTGSVGSTADLLLAIADLPNGSVVLPGFDPGLDPAIWQAVEADHPMGPFHRWMSAAGIAPSDVQNWQPGTPHPRGRLIAQALRPAPVTDHWHAAASNLNAIAAPATDGISLIEADSARLEASAIAIAIRETVQHSDQRVTLITPDAMLARRVTAQLGVFDIVPDDTSGQPLTQTPPGVLLSLVLLAASGQADAVQWAALLSHPLMQPGMARKAHQELAREYEVAVLRDAPPVSGQTSLPDWPQRWVEKRIERYPHAHEWLARLNAIFAECAAILQTKASLHTLLTAHINAAQTLTSGEDPDAPPALWRDDAGAQLQHFLDQLGDAADAFGTEPVHDYPALLRGLMRGETLRPKPRQPHPRVAIRGPRESRIEAADVVILAGLNEGTWPMTPDPGPWLSRPMYTEMGLPLPERSVGLSAHDFQQAISQPRVILSRARKIDGTPSVASRWLIRLQTLITGIGQKTAWQAMQTRGDTYLDLATRLAEPSEPIPRAPRPAPVLPAIPEPRKLSVTKIETLIRNAYAVYAQTILRLSPLNPLGRPADARERGNIVHKVMEQFTLATTPDWPGKDAARDLLMATADTVLSQEVPQPDLRRVWRARIQRFANWFIEAEDQRRANATPLQPEVLGEMEMALPNGPFRITAKADRIDKRNDGTAAIYDYKTGAPPSDKQIGVFSHQLHLQAAILATGGFLNIPQMDAVDGAYIGLTGGREGGKETAPEDLAGELPKFLQQIQELLTAYDTGAPWTALGRPDRQTYESDYDHLSRRDEWSGEEDA